MVHIQLQNSQHYTIGIAQWVLDHCYQMDKLDHGMMGPIYMECFSQWDVHHMNWALYNLPHGRDPGGKKTLTNLKRDSTSLIYFEDVQLLLGYKEASYSIPWFHDELFIKGTHPLARKIKWKVLKIGHALYLYTISTNKKPGSNDERPWHTNDDSILPMCTALQLFHDMHKPLMGLVTN